RRWRHGARGAPKRWWWRGIRWDSGWGPCDLRGAEPQTWGQRGVASSWVAGLPPSPAARGLPPQAGEGVPALLRDRRRLAAPLPPPAGEDARRADGGEACAYAPDLASTSGASRAGARRPRPWRGAGSP